MSSTCKITPDAPNGKESRLFRDLMSHTKNRTMAKAAWGFTQTDLFKSEFGNLDKDENGEPTYEALAEVLGLENLLSESANEMNRAVDMGLIRSNGSSGTFASTNAALAKANEFNKNAKNKVAVVRENEDGKVEVSIEDNTPMSIAQADINEARRNLNTGLISLLQRAGFDIEFIDDPAYNGIFNPLHAEQNARNLRTVIRVANGEQGLDAIPEEVSHLIIAGLKNDPLKGRLDAMFTDDVVRQILGDDYDRYASQYKNGKAPLSERLRDEAEGKALASYLQNGTVTEQAERAKPLLKRLWEQALSWIKSKLKISDIDNAFVNAQNVIRDVAGQVQDGSISRLLDRDMIEHSEAFFDLAEETNRLARLAIDGEMLLERRLHILEMTEPGKDKKSLEAAIRTVRKNYDHQQYVAACYITLDEIGKEVTSLLEEVKNLHGVYANTTDLNIISAEASLISRIKSVVVGYLPFAETLEELPYLIQTGQIQMDASSANTISQMAAQYVKQLNSMRKDLNTMRFEVLKQFITPFYGNMGEKPDTITETKDYKWQSVDELLSVALSDISAWDATLFSAGDSRNPLLNVIHRIVTQRQRVRDARIFELTSRLQEKQKKLHDAGYDNKFVYQYDSEGKPTGYYAGPIDWVKFEKAREAFENTLDPDVLTPSEMDQRRSTWEEKNMKEVEVGEPLTSDGKRRTERMPDPDIYKNERFNAGWSQEQQEYYDALIAMKAELDADLPPIKRNLYLAPQVRRSVTQMFDKDGRGARQTIWNKWKEKFHVVEDNTEYNTMGVFDLDNKEIKMVPIYYTAKMEDTRDMSTDATHAMFNYITMAVNYAEMSKVASAMRLMQDHVRDQYEVTQTRAGKPVLNIFKSLRRQYGAEVTKIGEGNRATKAILQFIDRTVFNETKEEIGSISIGDRAVSMDALYNMFMKLTSVSRIGLSPLSGITNVLQGETQIYAEIATGNHINMKDFAFGKAEYHKLLLDYLGQFNSIDRHDKMYMLINQFNSSEDYFRDMKDRDFNQSALKRVMGRGNVYFMNTMGEHYLHTMGMLMVLHHAKVRRMSDPQKKEVSLYDVIKQVHDKNGWRLELDDDIEFVDKNLSYLQGIIGGDSAVVTKDKTQKLFENLGLYINYLNASMHGGYSEAEKGNINQKALGRLLLQFRQWMFGMYNKLYTRPYYDATLNRTVEGAYHIVWRWFLATCHDMKNMTIKEALHRRKLTDYERRQMRLAGMQTGMSLMLIALSALTAGWKDKDDRNVRLLAYTIKRLETEVGALAIFPTKYFIENLFTLVQSPAAGISTLENISKMLDVFSGFTEVAAGRYKGWYKSVKAAYQLTPIYNIQKLIDMKDYNYMFSFFNK